LTISAPNCSATLSTPRLEKLHGTHYPESVREAIADRVIEFAWTTPERDPERLASAVLASLGIKL
jgi:hypothetical protein